MPRQAKLGQVSRAQGILEKRARDTHEASWGEHIGSYVTITGSNQEDQTRRSADVVGKQSRARLWAPSQGPSRHDKSEPSPDPRS